MIKLTKKPNLFMVFELMANAPIASKNMMNNWNKSNKICIEEDYKDASEEEECILDHYIPLSDQKPSYLVAIDARFLSICLSDTNDGFCPNFSLI